MMPPEGPPVCTPLNFLPSLMPPPISKMISRRVVPMGTSTKPELFTLPVRANTFVPLESAVPMLENHSAPLVRITGMLAQVSTLLMMVGQPHSPLMAGKGGFGVGIPRSPSMERRRAVSSPQTKAPAPRRISMSKSKPEPRMSLPKSPSSWACFMAIWRRSMASGYSARMYTNPWWAPIAFPQIIMASMTEWGSPSMVERSM